MRMPLFNVYFREPKVVGIVADNEDQARELFMSGEWDDSLPDRDGTIDEPTNIILMSQEDDA